MKFPHSLQEDLVEQSVNKYYFIHLLVLSSFWRIVNTYQLTNKIGIKKQAATKHFDKIHLGKSVT